MTLETVVLETPVISAISRIFTKTITSFRPNTTIGYGTRPMSIGKFIDRKTVAVPQLLSSFIFISTQADSFHQSVV